MKTYKRVVLFVLCLLAAGVAFGEFICPANPPKGLVLIYENQFEPGWSVSGTWGSTTVTEVQTPGQSVAAEKSLLLHYPVAWGGTGLYESSYSAYIGGRSHLALRIRKGSGTGDVLIGLHRPSGTVTWVNASNYLVVNQSTPFVAGKWYSIGIPIADFGAIDPYIQGVVFQSTVADDVWVDDVVFTEAPGLLFPLLGKTPYSSKVTAILDHSISVANGNYGYFHQNGIVEAYNGETSNVSKVCYNTSCTIAGYKKDVAGTPFNLPLLNYDDLDSGDSPQNPKNVLWYDGHPAYDYGEPRGTDILAAHSGVLCVSTDRTSSDGINPWRNTAKCPNGRDPINWASSDSWVKYHVFYILYTNTEYSTWYLHSDNLSSAVETALIQNGYADVVKGAYVADVGDWGVPGAVHLHFEVRKNLVTEVDPYGDGASGNPLMLWDLKP